MMRTISYIITIIMCKLKTKSAIKKRFKIKKNGTVVARCIGKRHNLRKRATKLKKFKTGLHVIPSCDASLIKRCARYGIK